jgi:1-acyl-sn-glycerol-3-phosphate acyltransferase
MPDPGPPAVRGSHRPGTTPPSLPSTPGPTPARPLEEAVLEILRELVRELQPRRGARLRVELDSLLDRELGLDSLALAELLLRIERRQGVHLPESLLTEAETPADLVTAARTLGSGAARAAAPAPSLPALPSATGALEQPHRARTLTEVLAWHVERHGERIHALLVSGTGGERPLTYAQLAADAGAVAQGLIARGLERGERVSLMLPTGDELLASFLGILLAGGVPVPIYPPPRPSRIEDHLRRQAGILRNAGAVLLIAAPETARVAGLLAPLVRDLRATVTTDELRAPGAAPLPDLAGDDTALLQYTSGSTGDPKGVVLGHDNLLANIRAMGEALEIRGGDVIVSWLPLYHDMGLIGCWLGSLYYGVPLVLSSPLTFLARPLHWLETVDRHRGTLTAAPNFAFELCLARIAEDAAEGLDLGSLRRMMNGAEPVHATTLRRFAQRFGRHGLSPTALAPVYGLAECSVGLTFPPCDRGPLIGCFDRVALARRGEAVPTPPDGPDALELVACGQPLPGHEVRVVDGTGRELAERREGRVEFRGPSATRGYFRNPEKTGQLFHGDWLDTGDLGFLSAGDLYLTGRVKDLVIRGGRNIHPQELERAVGEIVGVRKGCVAVFGSPDSRSGTERLVVLAETRLTDAAERERLRARIQEVATELLEAPADEVVLAPPQSVPKTSSGKIRRAAAQELYLRGRLETGPRALWLQVARLTFSGLAGRCRRALRVAATLAWAGWWWSVGAVLFAATWLAVVLLPVRRWRWSAVRRAARAMLALTGARLEVAGRPDELPRGAVVVANHSSYFDGPVLSAALPGELAFVAKRELAGQLVAGLLLRRLGTLFVERFDVDRALEDARLAGEAVTVGRRLVYFPEGTLRRQSGLMPFHLGAFVVAAEHGLPVIPVALLGTRSVLRGEQWLPRRGRIRVVVGEAIAPAGRGWEEAVRLRDRARAALLAATGEPDLATAPSS